MKNKIKQLPNIGIEEEPQKKKGKMLVIGLTCLGVIFIILFILYIIFIYNSNSNKLKRYLSTNDYTCYKKKCVKETKEERIEIIFKDFTFFVKNKEYSLSLDNSIFLETKDAYSCTYPKEKNSRVSLINNDLTIDKTCRKHIDSVNNYINNYQKMLNDAKIDVNELSN